MIATGPCIANQLRNVNTICRRSWYIAANVWKIYDFKIEVVPFIINFSTELTTVVKIKLFILRYLDPIQVKNKILQFKYKMYMLFTEIWLTYGTAWVSENVFSNFEDLH
jgi:hypothetical protein